MTVQTDELAAAAPIEVSGLAKTFGHHGVMRRGAPPIVAVRGVSFRLETGTTLAVVGESGSGKTTVARMIMGLEAPTSGRVTYFGESRPARPSARQRRAHARQVQMVFQNPYRSLDPRQPIGKAFDELLRLHFPWDAGRRAARTAELLELVRLDGGVLRALPAQLSGGQRQRVCIARALAAEPRVVILDEAVAALDMSVQAQVLNVLADVRDETGVSYLFVTHDLAVVRQIADEVVVMRAGEIVERGLAATVLDAPRHPYTRLLRDSAPREGWKPGRRAS
jgi:ABC-type glutathione transport system ATPase component